MGGERHKTNSGAAFEPKARAPLRSNTCGNLMQQMYFEHLTT
jgi:hypothetical protein